MPERMNRPLGRGFTFAVGMALAAGLAGCSTSADVAYGTYQFGPGYETGHVYESRVYGDTQQGIGAENCRTVMRRGADASGRPRSYEETVCD